MILEDYDENKEAIINPSDLNEKVVGFPKTVVTCFVRTTFKRMLSEFPHRQIAQLSAANLDIPFYELDFKGHKLGFFQLLCRL